MRIRLTVELLDTFRTRMGVIHENDHIPYGRRLVSVELLESQINRLKPKVVGIEGTREVYEELGSVWIEMKEDSDG